jgi:hypothetical protein
MTIVSLLIEAIDFCPKLTLFKPVPSQTEADLQSIESQVCQVLGGLLSLCKFKSAGKPVLDADFYKKWKIFANLLPYFSVYLAVNAKAIFQGASPFIPGTNREED